MRISRVLRGYGNIINNEKPDFEIWDSKVDL